MMEDKKQDLNSLEALVKTADSYGAFFANLANELSKVLADNKVPEKEEDTWEMKSLYKHGDYHWVVYDDGSIGEEKWLCFPEDDSRFLQGNIFQTEEEAELESKRRNLLKRFRAFRNECNGDWKPDWSGSKEIKSYIQYHEQFNKFVVNYTLNRNILQTFGFFKCKQDAERAIELFGNEIKKLYVDCEGE